LRCRCKDGSFSTKVFERYQRSKKALVLALMEMVVQGVSTRRIKKITTELCGWEFSKSTVSRLTKRLDKQVEAWDERSLDGDYPFLVLDTMHVKVRRQGGVRSTAVLLAVGIDEEGQREILGLHTALGETEEAWKSFLKQLSERGLTDVEHVTSDREAQEGNPTTAPWSNLDALSRASSPERARQNARRVVGSDERPDGRGPEPTLDTPSAEGTDLFLRIKIHK
jgi:transposase-like protein